MRKQSIRMLILMGLTVMCGTAVGTAYSPMAMFRGSMAVNAAHHLEIGGVDVVSIAQKSAYPIYVLDEQLVRQNMHAYVRSLKDYYDHPGPVFYASKALMTVAVCKIAEQEGMGIDVSTEGELHTALKAKFPMKQVILHGNNKSETELELALQSGVGRIVIDNLDDIQLLEAIAKKLDQKVSVLIRVKPGLYAHTHRHIATAHQESKFGFLIESGAAEEAILKTRISPHLSFEGLHVHIGSQILEMADYIKAIDLTTAFIQKLHHQGFEVKELNLGGGLGVVYTPEDKRVSIEIFVHTLSTHLKNRLKAFDLPLPRLMLEPGRSIIAEAGTTLYKVGSTKILNQGPMYVAVNGGMSDNIRPALYQASYYAVLANKMNAKPDTQVKIVGKSCESGDVLIEDIVLPKPQRGDVLAVFSTGAYNYSMASHYNRLPIPGVLLVYQGQADWIVKPEGIEDLMKNDRLPQRLDKRSPPVSK